MKDKISFLLIISVTFLIVGNIVGAGILALPSNAGLSGFIPTIIGLLIAGSVMFFTAFILSKEANTTKEPSFNFPSLYHKYLGNLGKWIAIAANLLILYGLITAYLTGATTIIVNLFNVKFPHFLILICFFLLITSVTISGMKLIRRYNALFILLMWIAFVFIVIIAERHVQINRLFYADWDFLPSAMPIILIAVAFHVIIPQVCKDLKWNSKLTVKVIFFAIIISIIMNIIWLQVGIGALPLEGEISLLSAYEKNLPITIPLAKEINWSLFVMSSLVFALLAIVTSYLATGVSLLGFVKDLTKNHFKRSNRILDLCISFGPPFVISLLYPDIFLKTLNVVGGIGVILLFGILPSAIGIKIFKKRVLRIISIILLFIFIVFLVFEILQEIGLLKIHPHIEYWNYG